MDLLTINPNDSLKFMKAESEHALSAKFEIYNKSGGTNATYKVKITARKLFVAMPNQGIICPNKSVIVEATIQASKISNISDILKKVHDLSYPNRKINS